MAKIFNFHLIDMVSKDRPMMDKNGMFTAYAKVVADLERWLKKVVEKVPQTFSGAKVWWSPDNYRPTLENTDVLVYVVANVNKSIIRARGGDVSLAVNNDTVLGLTNIVGTTSTSEAYWDRMVNTKELSGTAFHEAGHNKSLMGDEMHNGQNGFLRAAPDYLSSPTDKDFEFFAKHLDKVVQQG